MQVACFIFHLLSLSSFKLCVSELEEQSQPQLNPMPNIQSQTPLLPCTADVAVTVNQNKQEYNIIIVMWNVVMTICVANP